METWRRLALLAGICAAIWLFQLASLAPTYTVQAVDFAGEQHDLQPYIERDEYLAQLPLDRYIQEVTAQKTVQVQGEAWDEFFRNVSAASSGQPAAAEWTERIADSGGYRPARLYFHTDEPPLNALAGQLAPDGSGLASAGQEVYLAFKEAAGTRYLRLAYHAYSDDDFGFGGSIISRPPDFMFYPYRRFSPWLALAGLAVYLALPRAGKKPEVIAYPGWSLALGDFVACLLVAMFFGLPLFVIGGSVQAITQAWLATLGCWALAGLGVWLLLMLAWMAVYRLALLPDRLQVTTPQGRRDYLFADMASFRPVKVAPPRWFTRAAWVLSLVALLSGRLGAAGAGLAASTGEGEGVGIDMRDGSRLYLSLAANGRSRLVPGSDRIPAVLAEAGVPAIQEVQEVTSFGTVVGSVGDRVITAGPRFGWVWPAAALPVLLMVGYAVYVLGAGPAGVQLAPTRSGPSTPAAPANAALTLAARNKAVEWERTYADEVPAGDGRALLQTGDGGYLVAGDYAPGGRTLFALKTDAQGAREWLATASQMYGDGIAHSLVQTGDGGYLIAGETRWVSGKSGAIYLLKIAGTGAKEWEKSYDWSPEGRIEGCNLSVDDRGRATVIAWSGHAVYQLKVDAAGKGGWAPPITLSGLADSGQVSWIQPTADGGFVLAGVTQSRPGQFKDALLAKVGAGGKLVWQKAFGGERSETASFARPAGDGGYLLVGKAQPKNIDDDDLYLVKTNGDGDREWEGTFGNEADQSGVAVEPGADGGWLALADSEQGIYLVKTDPAGVQQWEQYLGERGYHANAVCPTPDGGAALTGTIFTGSLDPFLIKTRGG